MKYSLLKIWGDFILRRPIFSRPSWILLDQHLKIMCLCAWTRLYVHSRNLERPLSAIPIYVRKICEFSAACRVAARACKWQNKYQTYIISFHPVLCPKLTLIQPTWSAYIRITWFSLYGIRIPLFSLYGIHMPLFPYMVILPIVLGVALLWAAMDSPLSQGPLLWRHNDMTVIVSPDTRGPERDTRQRLDNANARRLQTFNR